MFAEAGALQSERELSRRPSGVEPSNLRLPSNNLTAQTSRRHGVSESPASMQAHGDSDSFYEAGPQYSRSMSIASRFSVDPIASKVPGRRWDRGSKATRSYWLVFPAWGRCGKTVWSGRQASWCREFFYCRSKQWIKLCDTDVSFGVS